MWYQQDEAFLAPMGKELREIEALRLGLRDLKSFNWTYERTNEHRLIGFPWAPDRVKNSNQTHQQPTITKSKIISVP